MFGTASRYYLSMSGERVITDGVGVLQNGQLTGLDGIEAASGSFANLSSQELADHEQQIAQNSEDILALQVGANVSASNAAAIAALQNRTSNLNNTSDISKPISTATQAALNLKLNITAAPTRASLGVDQTNNTSDLSKPISAATQAALDQKLDTTALDELGIVNDAAESIIFPNNLAGTLSSPSTLAYPSIDFQSVLYLQVRGRSNLSVTVDVPVAVFRTWANPSVHGPILSTRSLSFV
jgi:hypothetical protein